jgi:hypothetical protein
MAIWLINPEELAKLRRFHHRVAEGHSAATRAATGVVNVDDQPAATAEPPRLAPCN